MKLGLLNNSLLLSVCLLTQSIECNAQSLVDIKPTFREGSSVKNIAFFSVMGGASHYNWVLSIMDELGARGHNAHFIASDNNKHFGKPFSHVKTVSVGSSKKDLAMDGSLIEQPGYNYFKFITTVFENSYETFERDFHFMKQFFVDNNIDVAVCDHLGEPCVEAAISLKLPFIVTASADYTKESAAPYVNNNPIAMDSPTTEMESLWTRFKNSYLIPAEAVYHLAPFLKNLAARKRALGLESKFEHPQSKWKNSLKIVNTVYGFTAARPTSAMVEMVGPILPRTYSPLTQDLKDYLAKHRRIAYVAFGQMAVPSTKNTHLILTAILENVERGVLDGFIWSTVKADMSRFPKVLTTSFNTTYSMQDIFDNVYPHMRMVKWVPQTALLLHPSTHVFVSHGGLGSWQESMYAGTRMFMFPFFGDQPGNSATIESSGLGAVLKRDANPLQAAHLLKNVCESQKITENVKRYQALAQIYSSHGAAKGADAVEEVAYTHKDGILPHRQSADHRMSYIKAHNIDLFGFTVLAVGLPLYALAFAVSKLWTFMMTTKKNDKSLKYKTI